MAYETKKVLNFTEGLCELPLQGEGQVSLLQNARPRLTGGVEVRGGQTLDYSVGADPTIGSITGLLIHDDEEGKTHIYSIRRTADGDKFFDGETEITGPDLSSSPYTAIIPYKNTIFITNGTTHDIQYHEPGTTVRDVVIEKNDETLPQGQYGLSYKDRVYIFTNTGELRYSNAGLFSELPEVEFPDLNVQQIRDPNVEPTGIAFGEDILVLFTAGSYSIMTGTPGDRGNRNTYSLQEYLGEGVVASRTITSRDKRIFFLSAENRVKMLDGTILTDLDEEGFIEKTLQQSNYPEAASAQFLGREIWLSLPVANSPAERSILVYDIYTNKWLAKFTNIEGYAMAYSPSNRMVYVASHTGGYIWRQAHGAHQPALDPGDALIPFDLILGQFLFGTIWQTKLFKQLSVTSRVGYSEELTYTYEKDEEGLGSFTNFELNNVITEADHNYEDDYYGEENYGLSGLRTTVLRPFKNRELRASSLRLRIEGNLTGGSVIYGAQAEAEEQNRSGESGIA